MIVDCISFQSTIINRQSTIHGRGQWRKLKGIALVELDNGEIWLAEIHWYEAHGIGRKDFKIKRKIKRKS